MKTLSQHEASELARHEARIEQGITSAYRSLEAVRDGRLYRGTHQSFEDYCLDRWGISRRRAYQLIEAGKIGQELCTNGTQEGLDVLPLSERQARPLAQLETAEQRRAAYEEACEAVGDGKLTVKHIQAAVDHQLAMAESPEAEADEESGDPLIEYSPEWQDSELQRKADVEAGITVLANQNFDHELIPWARKRGIYIPIDRGCYPLGNPLKIADPRPDRDEVIAWYRHHWLPFVKSRIDWEALRGGKVLGCWCYPDACHGNVLLEIINESR